MKIGVLGPLTIEGADALSPRDRVVLQALTVDPGSVMSAEELAAALWPDDPPPSWSKVVQGCVMRIRRALGPDSIETSSHGYRLAAPFRDIDANLFAELASRGQELVALGDPERATVVLRDALSLWRGRAYPDLSEWDAGRIASNRLEELRHLCEEEVIEASLRAGRHLEVLAEAQARVAEQPLRERRWGLLARAEYQAGRRVEALRTIQRARSHMASETGLDLGADLVALEDAILAEDESLTVEPLSPEPATQCPFPGLVPYGVADADSFFGRDDAIREALSILAEKGYVVVVGRSGSGKSSLVRAGVAASLQQDGVEVRVITPGPHPMDVLGPIPDHVTLVVDQCEEAVTACEDPEERTSFFVELSDRAHHQPLVVALRADRIGDVSQEPAFARIVQRGLLLLGPLEGDDLRAAIEGPARRAGLLLEPGLMELLVSEVEGEPGALPLLSHALRRTWEMRDTRVLTVTAYRQTGGIRGAVSQSAESVYNGLTPDQRQRLRDLMLRLVAPGADGEPTPAAIPRRWIADDESHRRLIEILVDQRLVTSAGDTVEIAHEALTRAWPRLRTWLDDDIEGQRILRHLALAADSWESMGHPDSELYRGLRLENAVDWQTRERPDLTETERAFLERSTALASLEAEEEARRVAEQARTNRRLRLLLSGTALFLAMSLVAGFVALRSANRADAEAAAAVSARARALASASIGAIENDRSLSLLLAVEAERLAPSTMTRRAMLESLVGGGGMTRTEIVTGASDYVALALTGDGRTAVAKSADGNVDIIDLVTRRPTMTELPGLASPTGGLDLHPDRPLAAVAGFGGDRAVVVYDIETGDMVAELPAISQGLHWVAFSPNGSLAVAGQTGEIRIYDTDEWRQQDTVTTGASRPISALEFIDDGRTLVVADADFDEVDPATLTMFDVATGRRELGPVTTDQMYISDMVEVSGAEQLAAVGESVRWFSVTDFSPVGDPIGPLEVPGLTSVTTFPDGSVGVGSPVDLMLIHPAEGGPEVETIPVGAPGMAVTGDTLVTADIDGSISTWSLGPNIELGQPLEPEGSGLVTLSPDGAVLAVWGTGRGVQLFDRATLTHRGGVDIANDQSMLGVAFSGDGSVVATLHCPFDADPCVGTMNTWSTVDGSLIAGPVDVGPVWPLIDTAIVFVQGDGMLATASQTGAVRLWDATTLASIDIDLPLADHTPVPGDDVWGLASSTIDTVPFLAAFDQIGQSVVWRFDGPRPSPVGALANAFRVGFSPDGRLITSSGRGDMAFRDPFTLDRDPARDLHSDVPATSFSFGGEGVMVANGAFGSVLWDTDSGLQMSGTLPVMRSAISPDGEMLYLGGHPYFGGSVRVLSLDSADLIAEACHLAGRNLTDVEWRTLMGDEARRVTCPEWPLLE